MVSTWTPRSGSRPMEIQPFFQLDGEEELPEYFCVSELVLYRFTHAPVFTGIHMHIALCVKRETDRYIHIYIYAHTYAYIYNVIVLYTIHTRIINILYVHMYIHVYTQILPREIILYQLFSFEALVKKRIKYGVRDHRGVLCQPPSQPRRRHLKMVILGVPPAKTSKNPCVGRIPNSNNTTIGMWIGCW